MGMLFYSEADEVWAVEIYQTSQKFYSIYLKNSTMIMKAPLLLDKEDVDFTMHALKSLPQKQNVPFTTFYYVMIGAVRMAQQTPREDNEKRDPSV